MRHQHIHQPHYSYWKRTSAIPMSAALITGALSLAIGYSPESAHGQALSADDLLEPFVLVDVADFLESPPSFVIEAGECMDVNNDGFTVGWYEDASGDEQPFVFSPVDGGSAETLPLDQDWELGSAIAISETTDHDLTGTIIAGWADRNGNPEAVFWNYDSQNGWEFNIVPFNPARVGESQAVSDDGIITGYSIANSKEQAFVYNPATQSLTTTGSLQTVGMAIRDDVSDGQAIAGYKIVSGPADHAWYARGQTQQDLHTVVDSDYEESRALAMNNSVSSSEDVVGYVWDDDPAQGQPNFNAAYWWYDSGWDVGVFDTPSPDPVDHTVTGITDADASGYLDVVGHYATASLGRGVFYITLERVGSTVTYYSYEPGRLRTKAWCCIQARCATRPRPGQAMRSTTPRGSRGVMCKITRNSVPTTIGRVCTFPTITTTTACRTSVRFCTATRLTRTKTA